MENPRDAEGSAPTTLCRAGCGFYGSPAQEGLCSKCFKDALKKRQDPMGATANLSSPASTSSLGSTASSNSVSVPVPIPSSSVACLSAPTDDDASTPPSSSTPNSSLTNTASCPQLQGLPAKAKTRCAQCKKKVGLTGFECRCGGLYCSLHRYSDTHGCTFDYKALGEAEIRKANPVVAAQKINKI